MTAFICLLSPQQVVLAMDTLATDPSGNPAFFASKATHISHLKTLVAGTGTAGFANKWAEKVASGMVLTGILNLDYHTSRLLPELWNAYRSEHGIPEALTTTVYQFGVSEENGDVLGFAYRSTTGFASEALSSGWRFKPECAPPESDDVLSDIRSMMIEQRSIQDSVAIDKRVFIGGQCLVHVLVADGYTVMNLFDFDDFQDQVHEVFSNHSS